MLNKLLLLNLILQIDGSNIEKIDKLKNILGDNEIGKARN